MSESAFDYDQGAVTPPPTIAVRSWVVGFHGILHADDLEADDRPSLCALALGNRSLGMQRMRELTFLPGVTPLRANPSSTSGHQHLGAVQHDGLDAVDLADAVEAVERITGLQPQPVDSVGPHPVDPGPAATTLPVPWDPAEPLPDYLERRLGTARFLYLPNRSRA